MFNYFSDISKKILFDPLYEGKPYNRQERLFNNSLLSSILLFFFLSAASIRTYACSHHSFSGIPPWFFVSLLIIFSIIFFLSRKGDFIFYSYISVACGYLAISFGAYHWGIELALIIVGYIIIIFVSTIIMGTKTGFIMTGYISSTIIELGYFRSFSMIAPETNWKIEPFDFDTSFEYAAIFVLVMILSWLARSEIEIERNSLELKIEERTKQLKQSQIEQMSELYKFAEFGKLSSGLFHDLINCLTPLCLCIEELHSISIAKELHTYLQSAVQTTKRTEEFINSLRKQIKINESIEVFFPAQEIKEVVRLLMFKARRAQVTLYCNLDETLILKGNPLKFNQIVVNLISNAIDAYHDFIAKEIREVHVYLNREHNIIFSVTDFGSGIATEILPHIFESFYTTKDNLKGTGIGLSITKFITEKDFSGSISTDFTNGTTFKVILPSYVLE